MTPNEKRATLIQQACAEVIKLANKHRRIRYESTEQERIQVKEICKRVGVNHETVRKIVYHNESI